MSHQSFPYPIPPDALAAFCRPSPGHVFSQPAAGEGEILAANGYAAIRAHRGAWLDLDFPPATASFLARFEKIPWARYNPGPAVLWRTLADASGDLRRRGDIQLWAGGRLAPTPIWRVDEIPVRLSLLQLISRLPRCEVATGPSNPDDPLFFRFTGGRGAIARDPRLVLSSFQIFASPIDIFTGERAPRQSQAKPRFGQPGIVWPPPDLSEA